MSLISTRHYGNLPVVDNYYDQNQSKISQKKYSSPPARIKRNYHYQPKAVNKLEGSKENYLGQQIRVINKKQQNPSNLKQNNPFGSAEYYILKKPVSEINIQAKNKGVSRNTKSESIDQKVNNISMVIKKENLVPNIETIISKSNIVLVDRIIDNNLNKPRKVTISENEFVDRCFTLDNFYTKL